MEQPPANNPAIQLALKRLAVLELAQTLSSVNKACKQAGMDLTSFHKRKRRYQEHGLNGLENLPPLRKSCCFTTPEATQKKIITLSLANPTRGGDYVSAQLALEAIRVSAVAVHRICTNNDLRRRSNRLLTAEGQVLAQERELTPELARLIEEANSCFKERHMETTRPGKLLCQDTFWANST